MVNLDPPHARRSPRLAGYDYRQAALSFVTVCTQNREPLLGEIVAGEMRCNPAGHAVEHAWHALPHRFPSLALDAFVLMPNHVHGIVALGADPDMSADATPTLPAVLRAFKSLPAIDANRALNRPGHPFWQRGYHDHVIRHPRALARVRQYTENNPAHWPTDPDNPTTHGEPNAPTS